MKDLLWLGVALVIPIAGRLGYPQRRESMGVRAMRLDMRLVLLSVLAVILALGIGSPSPPSARADANDGSVTAGYDLHATGFAFKLLEDIEQIPANAFDPGSLPFEGRIDFEGNPLNEFLGFALPMPSASEPENRVDTIIHRLEDAVLPSVGSADTISVRMEALSLTSVSPIEVSYQDAHTELWDVDGQAPNNPNGEITFLRTSVEGGLLDAVIPIHSILTFTRQQDSAVRVFDLVSLGFPPILLTIEDLPWAFEPVSPPPNENHLITFVAGLSSGFVPAYDPQVGRVLSCGLAFSAGPQPRGEHGHFIAASTSVAFFDDSAPNDCLPVGGTTEILTDDSAAPAESAGSTNDYALPIAATAGLLFALAGGGLLMRRRFMR